MPPRTAAPSARPFSWEYIDVTPVSHDSNSAPYPFRLGVADRFPGDKEGERFVPSIRYAHASVISGENMIITHGYFYDMSTSDGGATWQSDTWSLSLTRRRWRRLHDHVRHPDEGPVARYGAAATLVGGDMFLHGGDDGGHAQGLPSYQQSIYGCLWRFILVPSAAHPLYTWLRVHTAVTYVVGSAAHLPSILSPSLPRDDLYRAQHAGALVLLGNQHELHREDSALESAAGGSAMKIAAPYLFISHGLHTVPRSADSSLPSSAGSSGKASSFDVIESDELFVFSFRSKQWRQMRTSAPPSPRFGHALVYVPDLRVQQGEADSQPRGALVLYGGFTRGGANKGDLWMLQLQDSTEGAADAFVWRELHSTFDATRGLTPGPRAYFGLVYTPDERLHLYGGARCEPACVCSGEYWAFDLRAHRQYEAEQRLATASSTSTMPAVTRAWQLVAASPFSPASRAYPSRDASGAGASTFVHAQESVNVGWPVHRYKHSMLLARASSESEAPSEWSMLIHGGESYHPSAYLQDTWALHVPTRFAEGTDAAALMRAHSALDTLLHNTPFPALEKPLSPSLRTEPSAFHVHAPPSGWGPYTPRTQHVLEWGASEPDAGMSSTPLLSSPESSVSGVRLIVAASVLLPVLLLAAVIIAACRTMRGDAAEKKRF